MAMKYKINIRDLQEVIGWLSQYDTDECSYAYVIKEEDWDNFLEEMAIGFKNVLKANASTVEQEPYTIQPI